MREKSFVLSEMDPKQRVAMAVTRFRTALGWSPEELSRCPGLLVVIVVLVEAGCDELTIDTLAALAEGLGIDVGRLFERQTRQ